MPAAIIMHERNALARYKGAEHAVLMLVWQMIPVHGSTSEPYLHCAGADVGLSARSTAGTCVVCGRSLPGAEADR